MPASTRVALIGKLAHCAKRPLSMVNPGVFPHDLNLSSSSSRSDLAISQILDIAKEVLPGAVLCESSNKGVELVLGTRVAEAEDSEVGELSLVKDCGVVFSGFVDSGTFEPQAEDSEVGELSLVKDCGVVLSGFVDSRTFELQASEVRNEYCGGALGLWRLCTVAVIAAPVSNLPKREETGHGGGESKTLRRSSKVMHMLSDDITDGRIGRVEPNRYEGKNEVSISIQAPLSVGGEA